MTNYYYAKTKGDFKKRVLRLLSLAMTAGGLLLALYVLFPLLSWQIYFAPVFASQDIAAPIPKTTILDTITLQSLLTQATNNLQGIDYTNAQNWFPTYKNRGAGKPKISEYTLSITKLHIKDAVVSTTDYDLSKHLVHYNGTAIPPDNGTAVIFGHSTLPQLFDPKNYKTIFATLHTLNINDAIDVTVGSVKYTYKIYSITVVDPKETSVFSQDFTTSFLTLVTCTPPGTVWKRLVIRAQLEKLHS